MAKYEIINNVNIGERAYKKGEIFEPTTANEKKAEVFLLNQGTLKLITDIKKDSTGTTIVDVKIPFLVKALPYIGTAGGAYFAYRRKSGVGGWIGWMVLGGLIGTAIAIPFAGKAMFKGLIGAAAEDMKKGGNVANINSGLSNSDKKKFVIDHAADYLIEDKTALALLLDKMTGGELTAFYITGAVPLKYGKTFFNGELTAQKINQVKSDFGVDISTPQFKSDTKSALTKVYGM